MPNTQCPAQDDPTNIILASEFTPVVKRLTKEQKIIAASLPQQEAGLLVAAYYTAQEERIRSAARLRRALGDATPSLVLDFYNAQAATLEEYAKAALDVYSYNHPVGSWMRSHYGIGPVLAAAHLAYIDIEKAPYAGHIWSYAGLTPSGVRRRGEKSNYNPAYKRICWLTGECFVKVSGNPNAFYGGLYKQFRALEDRQNANGAYAERAAKELASRKVDPTTEAWKAFNAGLLPKAMLHARAKLRTVKIFLSHVHHQLYVQRYGVAPPMPHAIGILGHYDYIAPPGALAAAE